MESTLNPREEYSISRTRYCRNEILYLPYEYQARLGLSEYQAVKQMYDGVKKLIEMEKKEK